MMDRDVELDELLGLVVVVVGARVLAVNAQIALVRHLLVAVEDQDRVFSKHELQLPVLVDLAHRVGNALEMQWEL